MTPARRDLLALLVKSPWWVVIGLVAGGATWAGDLKSEVREVRAAVNEGSSGPAIRLQRDLDSLRIESRHNTAAIVEMTQSMTELRHLVLRLGAVRRYAPTATTPLQPAAP